MNKSNDDDEMSGRSVRQKTLEGKKTSLKSVAFAVQKQKNEIPEEKVMVKKVGEMKTPEKQQ